MAAFGEIVTTVGLGSAVRRVAEAVGPASEGIQDPNEALTNLLLDDELTTAFRAPLTNLGFDLQSRELRNPYDAGDPTVWKVSVAKNASVEFYLVLVPFWILDDGRREHLAAFSFLGATFAKNSTIYMFARDLRDIDAPYRRMTEGWQQERSVRAIFTSWRDVTRLLRAAGQNQINLVREMLRLDELARNAAPPPVADPTLPTREEKSTIVDILARQAQDPLKTPDRYFTDLLAKVEIAPPFKFDDNDAEVSALKLVNFLLERMWIFPPAHPRSGEPTLGWLLKAVTDQILSPADNKKLATIIIDHNLIKEQNALNELRVSMQSGGPRK
jgi:hypothetical protein